MANNHNLAANEDAAHALGAHCKSILLAEASDAACYSYPPGNSLGAWGDDGTVHVLTRTVGQTHQSTNHGHICKYHHDTNGANSHIDMPYAAIITVIRQH
ncbi:MAG: hypothetical protein HOJ87_14545 [Rhodospirillaceae bacterium]|nr:hypothetical protein [Rhodospirillaceae bacterium]